MAFDLITILLALQQTLPVVMGPLGSTLLVSMVLASGALNAYQWRKSSQASQWEGAAMAHKENLDAVTQKCDRLEADNIELVKTSTELKAKTDLSSLERQNLEADRRNQEVHERIVLTLNNLLENSTSRHAQLSAVLLENTHAIKQLGERMANEFELHRGAFANMAMVLNGKLNHRSEPAHDRTHDRDSKKGESK